MREGINYRFTESLIVFLIKCFQFLFSGSKMGCFGSKDKLSKEDMDFLKSHTRYDEATIKEWYKGFKVSIYDDKFHKFNKEKESFKGWGRKSCKIPWIVESPWKEFGYVSSFSTTETMIKRTKKVSLIRSLLQSRSLFSG